jgi:UDP-N-acetylmuramyl pentapeptide phosphotransferase/UDP-N-acetylglucosamine-1-phosphate transferase
MLNPAEQTDTIRTPLPTALQRPATYVLAALSAGALGLEAIGCAAVALFAFWLLSKRTGGETPDKHGIASFHASRMGGVIFFTFAALCTAIGLATGATTLNYVVLALCVWMFAIGFFEDLHGLLPASTRLMLMVAGASAAVIVNPDIGLQTASVGFVKDLFMIGPWLTIPISVLGLSFLINSFNTADGANGLLGLVCTFAIVALMQYPGVLHADILAICAAGIVVFVILNLGFGNVFMGDGGAYFLGAVVGIALIDASNKGANLWWLLCLVFYPHVDLLWSMIRRIKAGMSPMGADNEHLHNLLFAKLRKVCKTDVRANSVTGVGIAAVFGGIPLLMTYAGISAWGTLYIALWVAYVATWFWLRPKPLDS